jgi:hypothetical protein
MLATKFLSGANAASCAGSAIAGVTNDAQHRSANNVERMNFLSLSLQARA